MVRGDQSAGDNGDDCDDDCSAVDRIYDGNDYNCDACSNGDMDDDYDASEHEGSQRTSLILSASLLKWI
jgi:hypothetical protein